MKIVPIGIFLLWSTTLLAAFGGGSGTEVDPFQIWTNDHFIELSQTPGHWDKHFIQMADLNLSDPNLPPLTPTGSYSTPFSGSYNGSGHLIKNVEMTFSENYGGVFGYINHAMISKVTLVDPKMTGLADVLCVGCLCGTVYNSTIEYCSIVNGSVTGGANGQSFGLLAGSSYSTLNHITCSGAVSGFYNVGGIVGYGGGTIDNSSFSGTVSGSYYIGGVGGTIRSSRVSQCFSRGMVSGSYYVGGFAGSLTSEISECYSQCNVSGYHHVGGFNGLSVGPYGRWPVIKNCYASGAVSGTSHVGGMTGSMSVSEYSNPTDFIGCFWDAEVNAGLLGIGNASDPDLVGESTVHLQTAQTFIDAGWDFAGEYDNGLWGIWTIASSQSYPTFAPPPIPGTGTPEDPYLISTSHHLRLVAENDVFWSSHIQVVEDIDLDYKPIESITNFSGVFDGGGHRIVRFGNKGQTWEPGPLFGRMRGGEVKNITFADPYLKSVAPAISLPVLCSYVQDSSVVTNCHVINGYVDGSTSSLDGTQSAGLIDYCTDSEVAGCSFQGTVIGFFASGLVTVNEGIIRDCYAHVTAQGGQSASGFVGYNHGTILRCSAGGTARASASAAGFALCNMGYNNIQYGGQNSYQGHIAQCTSSCTVDAHYTGGFVEQNVNAVIENCSARGAVSGYWACGFAGQHALDMYGLSARFTNCYAATTLRGTQKRGFVATLSGSAAVANCFWDTQRSGTYSSAGGVGKTTTQMQTQSTFAGWDFANIWYLLDYPILRWELSPLQARVDAAADGDVIVAEPGVYRGLLFMKGKHVTLTSTDPADAAVVAATVLDGAGRGSAVTFKGTEGAACVLDGLTITGGYSTRKGGGIDGNQCGATIRRCVIEDNRTTTSGGGIWGVNGLIERCVIRGNRAVYGGGLSACQGTIRNCLIAENGATQLGNAVSYSQGTLINCTIVSGVSASLCDNLLSGCSGALTNSILSAPARVFNSSTAQVTYCLGSGAAGEGNVEGDPLFVDAAGGDWHLLPGSPCIDAGDPASDYSLEPEPNGGRINLGAYGNTPEAALSRSGLEALGFEIVSTTRLSRTVFRYQLAVTVYNSNPFAMDDVCLRLVEADAAVIAVEDDLLNIPSVGAGQVLTSADTFTITVDRSQPLTTGRLTWELSYYATGELMPTTRLTIPLAALDPVAGDITGEGFVNLADLAVLAGQWSGAPGSPSADIAEPADGFVGLADLLMLAEHWLAGITE